MIVNLLDGVNAITELSLLNIMDSLISLIKFDGLGTLLMPTSSKALTHWIADPSNRGISLPSTSICM